MKIEPVRSFPTRVFTFNSREAFFADHVHPHLRILLISGIAHFRNCSFQEIARFRNYSFQVFAHFRIFLETSNLLKSRKLLQRRLRPELLQY